MENYLSYFITEEEFQQTVRHFAKVIIGKSPIDSERTGSYKSNLSRMIWSRGDLVFALHHHFVNLTSSDYSDKPLDIDLEQQLNVDWGIILPGMVQISKDNYWSYFKKFMSHEFYIKIADLHDNTPNQKTDLGKTISNGRTRITDEDDLNLYFSLNNERDKKATLTKVVSKKILIEAPAYYKLFDRYQDADGLNDYLRDNIKYIKETLSLCKVVEQGFTEKDVSLNDIELISDDKLFLVYIYYLYRYCEEKNQLEKAALLPTSPQAEPSIPDTTSGHQSQDKNNDTPENKNGNNKKDKVIYCPPQLIALSKSLSVKGFTVITQQELLPLHQLITISSKIKPTESKEKGKPTLEEDIQAYVKDKVIAIRWALDITTKNKSGDPPEEETLSTIRVENKIRLFFSKYLKIRIGVAMISAVIFVVGIIWAGFEIADTLKQSTRKQGELERQLRQVNRIVNTPVTQKIQEYLIPDSSFRHQYFINANDPLLKSLVLNKKSELIDHEIDAKLFDFKLSRENKEIQPLYIFGSKKDSIDFKITQSKKLYKNMEFIWIVYKYINTPQNNPKISLMDIRFSKLREKNCFQINDSLTKEAVKIQRHPFSGTYVVLGMACPYNWHSENKLKFQNINERVKWRMKNGIVDVTINTEGAVHVGGFMAFDIIDPSEN